MVHITTETVLRRQTKLHRRVDCSAQTPGNPAPRQSEFASERGTRTVPASSSSAARAECRRGRDSARRVWASSYPRRSPRPASLAPSRRLAPTAARPPLEFVFPGQDQDDAALCLQKLSELIPSTS